MGTLSLVGFFPAPRQEPEEETGNFPAVIPLLMLPL